MDKVVTYQSSRGERVALCRKHETERRAADNWPRDHAGEEICGVHMGLHWGVCSDCEDGTVR